MTALKKKRRVRQHCRGCPRPIGSSSRTGLCPECYSASLRSWDIEDMIEMHFAGATLGEIARRFNRSRERVRSVLLFNWRSDRRRIWPRSLGDLDIMLGVNVAYRPRGK